MDKITEDYNSIVLKQSISADKETFLWCYHVLRLKKVQKKSKSYKRFNLLRKLLLNNFLLILLSLLMTFLLNKCFIIISCFLATLSIIFLKKIKTEVRELGFNLLIEENAEIDLLEDTLYLLCEQLSHKFKCPSLVDMIDLRDKVIVCSLPLAVFAGLFLNFGYNLQARLVVLLAFIVVIPLLIEKMFLRLYFK